MASSDSSLHRNMKIATQALVGKNRRKEGKLGCNSSLCTHTRVDYDDDEKDKSHFQDTSSQVRSRHRILFFRMQKLWTTILWNRSPSLLFFCSATN